MCNQQRSVAISLIIALSISLRASASSHEVRATALSNVEHTTYATLRSCVLNVSESQVGACFAAAAPDSSAPRLLVNGTPPIIIVPDCRESLLELCERSKCSPVFFASVPTIPPTASLFLPEVPDSVFAIEAAYPPRRIPGGPYTVLTRTLLSAGYKDGVTLRASAWDWRVPDASSAATVATMRLLKSAPGALLVARGVGCTVAAHALKDIPNACALLCLADPPNNSPNFGLYETELGLRARRRPRPLPIVSGPWGDGLTYDQCNAHKKSGPASVDTVAPIPVRCNGDCRRWLSSARPVDCARYSSLIDEIECLWRDVPKQKN